jgi:hypothetical protein|tara:strand:- start:9501 stop:9911 length:411 start_codon:yes stop_codon:yes gene_type:complete
MEENKHIKEFDAFAKKYLKEIKTESLSKDFTASLMNKIVLENSKSVINTKALISKKVWVVIFASVLAVVLIPFKASEKSLITMPKLDFSFLEKIQIPNLLENVSVSNTVMYAILFFGLMFMVQVIFLKNHFNKRFE